MNKGMKARDLIIAGILLLLPCSLRAQDGTQDEVAGKDPLYLQLYLGINKSANENLPWTEFSTYPWSGGMFVGIGQEFTPLWGWRAVVRANYNRSRNVPLCENGEPWGWGSLSVFGDMTFDITDAIRGKNRKPSALFDLKAFAGVGLAYTGGFDHVPLSYTHPYLRESLVIPGMRLGVTANFRVAEQWRVGMELSHSWFEDHFNGVAYGLPLDGRTNIKVGVTYLLAKKKKKEPVEIVRSHKLKDCPALPMLIPAPEPVKVRQLTGRAFLDFPVNETVIYPSYRKNPDELARIDATVEAAVFDTTVSVKSLMLHGYASPESPYDNNTRLAEGRVESLKNYLMGKYAFSPELFDIRATPEDWGNLRGFLENTEGRRVKGEFWYDSQHYVETPSVPASILRFREELLEVIDREMDPDEKEEQLKKVGGGEPYRWLYRYVYPGLRHTDYLISYEVRAYEAKDGRRLIYSHPEALSLNEMYQVALSYREGSEEWFDAFIIAARQYPQDETANLNAACACVRTKRLTEARKYLKNAGNSPQANYLGDVILAMEGQVNWRLEGGRVKIAP